MTSAGAAFSKRELVLLDAAMNTYIQVLRCQRWRETAVMEELDDLKCRLEQMVLHENAVA